MELKLILESILFSAQQPMSPKDLKSVLAGAVEHSEDPEVKKLKRSSIDTITQALEELQEDHADAQRSFHLACVAGSWQFVSKTDYAPWIKALVGHRARPPRLSQPALETLAIIAYRQPLTRSEIEQIRGVAVDGVMHTLMERGLVEQVGRAEVPGRPITYGTSPIFLEYFGLASLEELPVADELRRIPVEKPEALLTVDPGLATAPPEELSHEDENGQHDTQTSISTPRDAADGKDEDDEEEEYDEDDEDEYDDEDDEEEEDVMENEETAKTDNGAPTSSRGKSGTSRSAAD